MAASRQDYQLSVFIIILEPMIHCRDVSRAILNTIGPHHGVFEEDFAFFPVQWAFQEHHDFTPGLLLVDSRTPGSDIILK